MDKKEALKAKLAQVKRMPQTDFYKKLGVELEKKIEQIEKPLTK